MADTAKYSSQTSLLTRLSMINPDERQIADAIAMARAAMGKVRPVLPSSRFGTFLVSC